MVEHEVSPWTTGAWYPFRKFPKIMKHIHPTKYNVVGLWNAFTMLLKIVPSYIILP
jgi:hypothetical protein